MVVVRVTTDQVPELADVLALRKAQGLDTYDEWWEGVYRIVTGPSPEHGRLLDELAELLGPLVRAAGLYSAAPANIGHDKVNCRVPDRAIYAPDTPRTSPAFLATALLVIEVLSPGEKPKEKLDFYAARGVREYLEIDLEGRTVDLMIWVQGPWPVAGKWELDTVSEVLPGLEVVDNRIHTPDRTLDPPLWPEGT